MKKFNADRYQTRKFFTGGDAPQDFLVKISFAHCIRDRRKFCVIDSI